jgi:hypothetical protein
VAGGGSSADGSAEGANDKEKAQYRIVVLAMCAVGWLVFAVWMILTVALYVGGWVYYLMVMSGPPTWDIDFEL